jgi:GNAT superfamily N-acetyltransferase
METRVLSHGEFIEFVRSLPFTPTVGILLGGDRINCCDEGVALEVDGQIVGVATIAPDGEECSGTPTLVAIYVHPLHRRNGYARVIAEAAARRCKERGFNRVRVDVISAYALRVFTSLPSELRSIFDIHDQGGMMDSLP